MSKNWPLHRRIISWGARTLARPLTSASDPMTGFFGLTKDQVHTFRPLHQLASPLTSEEWSTVASLQADQPCRLQDRPRTPPQIASPRHAARSPLLVRDPDHRLLETFIQSHAQIRRPAHLALRLGVGRLFPRARRGRGHDRGAARRQGVAIEETAVDARAGVPAGRVPPGRGRAAVESQSQISERSIARWQSRLDEQNRRCRRRRDIGLGRKRRQRREQPGPRAETLCMIETHAHAHLSDHWFDADRFHISHCTIVESAAISQCAACRPKDGELVESISFELSVCRSALSDLPFNTPDVVSLTAYDLFFQGDRA